jgi:DNA polymerase-3 subunit gamma/tau
VDYTELDAASNRGVDEVQALLEQAVYKPVQGRFKVFMIDEVHMLTNTAFNAMLKTLEEPPEYLKFVLATTDPQKVPVTVLSRCLQFNLRPMAPETIREHLQQVLALEGVSADVQSLRLLARAARGSMRDALSLTDQAIAFGSGQLTEAPVRQMLGSVDRTYVFRLIEALALGDGKTVVETSEALRLNGLNAASTLEEMSTVLQAMAVLQTVGQASVTEEDSTDPEAADIARLAALMPRDETQLLYSICLHGRGDLGLAPDEYAALTMVLLRLLAFKPTAVSVEKKSLKPEQAAVPKVQPWDDAPPGQVLPVRASALPTEEFESNDAASNLMPPVAPIPSKLVSVPVRVQAESRSEVLNAAQSVPVLVPTEEGDYWHATVQQLIDAQTITAMVRELALQSQLVARDEDQWILRVERESLNQAGSRERLIQALQTLGLTVNLAVEVGRVTDSPGRRNASASAERQMAAEQRIHQAPFVQRMMHEFGARVVPGSIRPL